MRNIIILLPSSLLLLVAFSQRFPSFRVLCSNLGVKDRKSGRNVKENCQLSEKHTWVACYVHFKNYLSALLRRVLWPLLCAIPAEQSRAIRMCVFIIYIEFCRHRNA